MSSWWSFSCSSTQEERSFLNSGHSALQKETAPGGLVFILFYFHSHEVASLGKDVAWKIFTYVLFPKLRLSVEHSLPKILAIFLKWSYFKPNLLYYI